MLRYLLLLAAVYTAVDSYKVLVIFPVPSHSHAALGRGVVRALLKHSPNAEITFVSAFPEKNPQKGVTEIDVSKGKSLTADICDKNNLGDEVQQKDVDMVSNQMRKANDFNFIKSFASNITKMLMETPAVREAIINTNFDAVVSEWFFSDEHAGFAAVLQCPWILFSGTVMHPHMEILMDTMSSPAIIPIMTSDLPIPMNFWQRIKNTFAVYMMFTMITWWDKPNTSNLYKEYFEPLANARGVSLPDFDSALHNASIMLVNSHPSIAWAQPLPPNVVEIGGFHIDEETPKLPEDLQRLLDQANEGVVYFSMGSVVRSSKLPAEMRKELLQILGELPYTVLWKFEEPMENLPKNVHVMQWVPQQGVLAHPNVKIFITHGGLLSSLEAVHFGVPLIAIPIFGDQPSNADRAVRNGYAIKVDFPNVAKELRTALKTMSNDNRYYNRVKELSKLFRSRPVSPSKNIAHYIELAIESKGAYHLRSKARLYPWYQRLLLDQIAFVLILFSIAVSCVKRMIRLFAKGGKKEKRH